MQLTLHTDYALRVLLYLAHFPERKASTAEISLAYGISKHHLVRVVQSLAQGGFVTVTAGRGGGATLAKRPEEIRLGDVVRRTETSFRMVECFDMATNTCPITGVCGLKGRIANARDAFLAELDKHQLSDIVTRQNQAAFIRLTGGA
jgi:Rrf2 family transcriptional regulator, nitric oxide-sensitive transcriptional repressor